MLNLFTSIKSEVIETKDIENLEHMRERAIKLDAQAREAWIAYANAKIAFTIINN